MRRVVAALLLAPLVIGAALLGRSAAQQPGGAQPFRAVAGRYAPAPMKVAGDLMVLDTWTGRLHGAGDGAGGEGEAWVIDLPEALKWERPLARDVSGGHVLQHGMPLAGVGAGAPVFEWHPLVEQLPGVLDTRTGVHYALDGGGTKIVRTDLRLLTRSERTVRTAAKKD